MVFLKIKFLLCDGNVLYDVCYVVLRFFFGSIFRLVCGIFFFLIGIEKM